MKSLSLLRLALVALAAAMIQPVQAQGLFAPVIQINDRVVTQYEVDQRARFLSLLNAPGVPQQEALDRLIDEKLQLDAARANGIVLTPDDIQKGIDEFAGRSNLPADQFIKALEAQGVARQTLRDFVVAGLSWRDTVRKRFGPQVTISDADIDAALSVTVPRAGAIRILFSEIILPANTPAAKADSERRAAEIATYTSIDRFSQAARAFSASPSRDRGGRLDWVEVKNISPGLAQQLLALAPGQVTKPLPIPNGIALFQLRQVEDGVAPPPQPVTVDYAVYRTAQPAEALAIAARTDTCNDLMEAARKHPADRVARESAAMSAIPADVALELAKLDDNEISSGLTRTGQGVLVMLCSRRIALPDQVSRDDIRARLANDRLTELADAYLAELRADAIIKKP